MSGAGGTGGRIRVEREGPVGTLTLDRPEKLNAFAGTMRDDLAAGLESLAGDDAIRAVIVTGRGRAFCAGADVSYLAELIEGRRLEEASALVEAGRRAVTAIAEMPKPVIAALNGPAAGGGANLALACDLRLFSDRASIGQTFNRIGLHPDWGGTYFLPRLVGPARATELFFLAEMVEAEEALEMGLANRVVPHDRLMEEAEALARRLAAKPALPIRLAKRAVRRSLASSMEEMLDYELEAQRACFGSADAREGVRAFLEKREAAFGADPESDASSGSGRGASPGSESGTAAGPEGGTADAGGARKG